MRYLKTEEPMDETDRAIDKMIGALVSEVDRGLVKLARDLGVERRRTLCRSNGGPMFWLGWAVEKPSGEPGRRNFSFSIGLTGP